MIIDDLKPCPFCGFKAAIRGVKGGGYQVGCENEDCGCKLPSWLPFAEDDDSDVIEKIKSAIYYWNERVGDKNDTSTN